MKAKSWVNGNGVEAVGIEDSKEDDTGVFVYNS